MNIHRSPRSFVIRLTLSGVAALVALKQAQAIDDRERAMYPFIRQFKSLQAAIAKFNRI